MATYRIARLTCTTCNTVQRVRVAVGAAGETFPACPDCGPTTWSVGPVARPTPVSSFLDVAPPDDVAAFWADMRTERDEYYERRFLEWKAERTERRSRLADVYHHDLARMFREVFDLLG